MHEKHLNEKDADTGRSWKSLLPVLSIKLVLISLLFIAAIFTFALIAHEAVLEEEDVFDRRILQLLSAYNTTGLINVMRTLTFFGSSNFLFPAYVILVLYLLIIHRRRIAINISVIGLSSTGMLHLLKRIFQRDRPDLPLITSLNTFSFPSGHAVSSFIFCMILVHLIWETGLSRALKWFCSILLLLFSISIGLSRIVLKVHYPSDVLAGFCLGLVWVLVSFWLLKRIENKEARRQQQLRHR
jgi:undecaprenyl-diphosphatase